MPKNRSHHKKRQYLIPSRAPVENQTHGITAEYVLVTPETAADYLERVYDDDRNVREQVVVRYADDMKANRWIVTHQGLAFDLDDHLIDGQHRLWAIISSGVSCWLLIVRGLPTEARLAMDQGAVRSVPDLAHEAWINVDAAAIGRKLILGAGINVNLSRRAVIDYIKKHERAIRYSLTFGAPKEFKRAAFRSAVAAAHYHEPEEQLDQLRASLIKGWDEDNYRSATIGLAVRYLTSLTGGVGGDKRNVHLRDEYLKCQRIVKAFVHHENLSRIYAPDVAIYSVP